MRTVLWENSFRRALKRLLRKNPQLQQKVTEVLRLLESEPFTPSLKTHKYKETCKDCGLAQLSMTAALSLRLSQLRILRRMRSF